MNNMPIYPTAFVNLQSQTIYNRYCPAKPAARASGAITFPNLGDKEPTEFNPAWERLVPEVVVLLEPMALAFAVAFPEIAPDFEAGEAEDVNATAN
jgi:hypothetical protein